MKSPEIHRTPKYRAKAAYANMKRRCENACGTEPTYTNVKLKMSLEEWLTWAIPEYEKFLKQHPNKIPSVSRNGDVGDYELGNISITSINENINQRKTNSTTYNLICPICRTNFIRSAQRAGNSIRKGKRLTCSRQCGYKYATIIKKLGSGM